MSKKPKFTTGLEIGQQYIDTATLRSAALHNPEAFAKTVDGLINEKKLRWGDIGNLQKMWHALSDVQVKVSMPVMNEMRAINASAFPLLAGGLTVAGMNDAYEAVPTIGEKLVTEMDDNKRVTVVAGISTLDSQIDRVDEGADFPEISAGEEKFEIRSKRNGRRLSITAEMIEENDVANIVERTNALGYIAASFVEEQTLRRVCDIDGSGTSPAEPYVLRLNGSGTSLYSTTANTPGTRAPSGTRINSNALADETDLDAARAVLAAMKDSLGKRIAIPMTQCILLVPDELLGTAWQLRNSDYTPGVENEINTWGPRGMWQPTIVSSPKLSDLSTTVWYLGAFDKQFKRKWKLRFEYVTLAGDTESFLRSRLAFQARVAWDCEVGATDYVYVVQSLSATTAP